MSDHSLLVSVQGVCTCMGGEVSSHAGHRQASRAFSIALDTVIALKTFSYLPSPVHFAIQNCTNILPKRSILL